MLLVPIVRIVGAVRVRKPVSPLVVETIWIAIRWGVIVAGSVAPISVVRTIRGAVVAESAAPDRRAVVKSSRAAGKSLLAAGETLLVRKRLPAGGLTRSALAGK